MSRTRAAPAALARPPLGIDERAQIIEAISSHQSRGYQFPQRSLDFRLQLACTAYDVGKERRATLPQKVEYFLCSVAQAAIFRQLGAGMPRRHPIGIFSNEECYGSNAGGNYAPLSRRRTRL